VQLYYIHKESKLTCCTVLIFSQISNMFRPDWLAIFMESYAAIFQIRIISYGYSCCVYNY